MRFALLTASCAAVLSSAVCAQASRPDRNAFVNRKITTTQSLIDQVRSDPAVADRYQRHFAMNRGQVVSYLSGLHRGTMTRPGVYTIYSVPNDGHVKMHLGKLKKGDAVFLNRKGQPILVALCGNPLVLGPMRASLPNQLAMHMTPVGPRAFDATPDMMAEEVDDTADILALDPRVPEYEDETQDDNMPGLLGPLAGPGVPGPIGNPFPLGSVAAGLASLGAIEFSRGGGGGGAQPVPEPATLLVLGMGVGAFVRRRRKG